VGTGRVYGDAKLRPVVSGFGRRLAALASFSEEGTRKAVRPISPTAERIPCQAGG